MKINKIWKSLGLAGLLIGALSLTTACTDDLIADTEIFQNAYGTYGPFDLEVAFDMERNETQSRATFETKDFKMDCAWVGMFTAKTGKLVAMATNIDPDDGNTFGGTNPDTDHNAGMGGDFKVKLRSLMLSDENDSVYIAGVANYKGIIAIDDNGSEIPLESVLKDIKDISDYRNIKIKTASAEQAIAQENKPLMAGFWGTSHGNFTVNPEGVVLTNNSAQPKVKMLDSTTKKVIGQSNIDKGMIHLRRLYSQIKVDVTVDMNGFRKFRNPRVRVLNVPAYTFLQEHTTIENAADYTDSSWPEVTATAADLFEDGYFDTDEISVSSKRFIETDCGAFVMNDDYSQQTDNSDNVTSMSFNFWHYETKHWGLESVKSQNDRERMMAGDSRIYASLCPSSDRTFNNKAACIVITADVESADGKYYGTADFYVHEGYCCKPNGDAATDQTDAARDFSTFRNVAYNYKVKISGMESVDMKVTSTDLSGDFYQGVGGDLYSKSQTRRVSVPKGGITYDIELPGGRLFWYIESEGEEFGIPLSPDADILEWYGDVYKYTGEERIVETNAFYQSIRLNDYPLGDGVVNSAVSRAGGPNRISFTGEEGLNGMLYLCAVQQSPDKMVTYYTVYQFDQSGKLATPELKMLKAPSGNLIMGIDDHTVYWKPISGADSYTIELVANGESGGYRITVPANGSEVSDASVIPDGTPINVKIERETVDEVAYLKFRVRYANKSGGMMSFFRNGNSSPATIRVTANKSTGESSEPGSITRTIINPLWDFSEAAYRDAVKAQTGVTTGAIGPQNTVTYNKFTMHTGEEDRLVFQSYGGYYGYNPGGGGSKSKFHFSFHACSRGHVKAYTSSNNNNTNVGRYAQVDYTGNSNGLIVSQDATAKAVNSGYSEIKMDSFNPAGQDGSADNVFVMNSGNIIFYKVSFTPEDI